MAKYYARIAQDTLSTISNERKEMSRYSYLCFFTTVQINVFIRNLNVNVSFHTIFIRSISWKMINNYLPNIIIKKYVFLT